MEKGDKITCESTDGGGTQYDDGVWIIKTKTDKTLVVALVSEPGFFSNYEKGDTIKVGAKHGNPVRNWDDGSFTVYPGQAGTPYYFEPVEAAK